MKNNQRPRLRKHSLLSNHESEYAEEFGREKRIPSKGRLMEPIFRASPSVKKFGINKTAPSSKAERPSHSPERADVLFYSFHAYEFIGLSYRDGENAKVNPINFRQNTHI